MYFDDDNTSIATLDLSEISDKMSGQLKLQFEFYPNNSDDHEKACLADARVKDAVEKR